MSVQVLRTIAAMRTARHGVNTHDSVALVPTMGALHEGHRSLIRAAKEMCEVVVVSIFVNPTQFGANEDFALYPRTFEEDLKVLSEEGVDFVFAPSDKVMYPAGEAQAWVDVGELGTRLDGQARPGHFRGVATVVAKLFHIVQPDVAFFGQKDAAQCAVLKAMVRQLNFPVQLCVCPTVRENDGLAMSSRNRYLSAKERTQALALARALELAQGLANDGVSAAAELRQVLQETLRTAPGLVLEYAEVVDPDTLLPLDDVREGALVAVAGRFGKTRLIDNVVLAPQEAAVPA